VIWGPRPWRGSTKKRTNGPEPRTEETCCLHS
jgi:hypothetical protein